MSAPKVKLLSDERAILDALTSDNNVARVMGRAVASGWPDAFQKWANAEMHRAGKGQQADLLVVTAQLQAQIYASVIASLVQPGSPGVAAAIELYRSIFEQILPEHVERVAVAMRQMQGGRA